MNHAAKLRCLAAAGLLLASFCSAAGAAPPEATVLTGRTMGTTYRLKYWGEGLQSPRQVQDAVERFLANFDRQMSTYRDDSELSRFNRAAANKWFDVSAATAVVVAQAIELHKSSGGVYDVTVAPALRLWNFGPGAARDGKAAAPSAEQLAAVRRFIGSQYLEVRLAPPALRKTVAGVEVDLSSIAPGYAVDLVIELLAEAGFPNAIVECGGEVRAVGAQVEGDAWRVGVERPATQPPTLSQVVPLRDLALSTSGDYRNFRVIDGKRIAHILDARTLRPLPYRGMSVTVLAATCAEADALGTALLVMGPETGLKWCIDRDVAAMFQYRAEGEVENGSEPSAERLLTPRFSAFLLPEGVSATR